MRTLAAVLLLFAAGCSCCEEPAPAPAAPPPAGAADAAAPAAPAPAAAAEVKIEFTAPSKGYPLAVCVVSGEDLAMGGEPVAVVIDGTEVQLCCSHCVAELRKDPMKYVAIVRRATPSK